MKVYFIQSGKKGPVKIGVSSDPIERMKTMQTGNPENLKLIAELICKSKKHAYEIEYKLHKRFKWAKKRGEWFNPIVKARFNQINEVEADKIIRHKK